MAGPTPLAAGRAPSAPPGPVVSKLESQIAGDVFDSGPGPDSDVWTPVETVIATIPVDGPVHDIAVSPDGEHVYVARADSVVVIDGGHRIVRRIPLGGAAKSLVTNAGGDQLFVIDYDGP